MSKNIRYETVGIFITIKNVTKFQYKYKMVKFRINLKKSYFSWEKRYLYNIFVYDHEKLTNFFAILLHLLAKARTSVYIYYNVLCAIFSVFPINRF